MPETLEQRVMRHEGFAAYPIPDAKGEWEIGYGHDITKKEAQTTYQYGIDAAAAQKLLEADLDLRRDEVSNAFSWFGSLDRLRQEVLIEMCYQMGLAGLLGFKRMLLAVSFGSFGAASGDMLMSAWADETPARCQELALIMRTGVAER